MTSGSSTLQSSLRSELEDESQSPPLDDDATELGVGIMTIPDSNMLAAPIIPRLFGLAAGGGDGDSPRVPAGLWDQEADDSGGDGMPSPLAVAPTSSSRFTA